MNSTYLYPSNIQFTFRDTEVNEGQVLDRILRFRNKGREFINQHVVGASHHVVTDAARRIDGFREKGRQFAGEINGKIKDKINDAYVKAADKIPRIANEFKPSDINDLQDARDFIANAPDFLHHAHNIVLKAATHVPDVVHNIAHNAFSFVS